LISNLWELKGYGAQRLIQEFPDKKWKRRGIKNLSRIRKVHKIGLLVLLTGSADHAHHAAVWCSIEQSLIDGRVDQHPAH